MQNNASIVVPIQFIPADAVLLRQAEQRALATGAKLILLHPVRLNIAGEELGIPRAQLFDQLCLEAEMKLKCMASQVNPSLSVETLVGAASVVRFHASPLRRLRDAFAAALAKLRFGGTLPPETEDAQPHHQII